MAVRRYFLGANTGKGFVSLYDEFCKPESGNFLYVIKGGPGCGKSSFMKKIGKAAEDAGLDVEYVICSGDPDSLDGVLIPAWHVGYADGTQPAHSRRRAPRCLGRILQTSGSSTMLRRFGQSARCSPI